MEPELSAPGVGVAVLAAAGVVALLALLVGTRRPRRARGAVRVAHTARLRALPSYRRAVRRRRTGLVATAVVTVAAIGVTAWVAARPTVLETRASRLDNRDIVLCLDVSASMNEENLAIVRSMRSLASRLEGERIGLVVFDSTPLVLFPLTDDYDLVRSRLEEVERGMTEAAEDGRAADLAASVRNLTLGQSLVGDGLMGCTQQFAGDAALEALRASAAPDAAGPEPADAAADAAAGAPAGATVPRSRVVLLATDNEQGNRRGAQLFTVSEAAQEAAALGAMVVVLDAASDARPGASAELEAAAAATGGARYPAGAGEQAVAEITAIVEGLDSSVVEGEPLTARFDVPDRALDALLPLLLVLLVLWRVVRP